MPVLGGIDELHFDPHPVLGSQHGPLDDSVHAQLLRDLGKGLPRALVAHGGGAGDHLQRPDRGKIRDQLIRQAVGKVLLLRIAGQIGERKHGKRPDAASGGAAGGLLAPPSHVDAQEDHRRERHGTGGIEPPMRTCGPSHGMGAGLEHLKRGVHFTRKLVPLARLLGEATLDQGAQSGMDALGQRRRLIFEDRAAQLRHRTSFEGKLARSHVVQHHAQRPDVALGRRALSTQDLRAQVRGRPHDGPRRGGRDAQRFGRALFVHHLKSRTTARPSVVRITLFDLRSRWMTPWRWA